jgi:hypothetical protein
VRSAAFSPDGRWIVLSFGRTAEVLDVRWATLAHGETLRERVCAEKLVAAAQEFTAEELDNPILRGVDKNDPVARNPCLRRGPLSREYWTRLPSDLWHFVGGTLLTE